MDSLDKRRSPGSSRMRRAATGLAAIAAACMALASPASAEYRLAPGDIIEISVAGFPELKLRNAIQLDGHIAIPLVGRIRLQGLTAAEMQTRIEAAMASKQLRQKMPDGRDRVVMIQLGDVAATVAEYRPIFVSGSVLNPNQHPYRQAMTVRHAVALSGGYGVSRGMAGPTSYDQLDLKRDYKDLAIELAKEDAYARRLKAAIEGKDELGPAVRLDAPVPQGLLVELEDAEKRALKITRLAYEREKEFLENSIVQSEEQISLLSQQEAEEKDGLQSEADDRKRVDQLVKKGTVTVPRVIEARRAMLRSSSGLTRVKVDLARSKQERDGFVSRLQNLDTQRNLELLQNTTTARARIASLRVRLDTTAEKLRRSGGLIGGDDRPHISIIRSNNGIWQRIAADEDAEVSPGDIVEVGLRTDHIAYLGDKPATDTVREPAGFGSSTAMQPPNRDMR